MRKSEKHSIKKIQIVTYVIIVVLIVIALILDVNSNIDLGTEFVFIMFGFILMPMGIFGLINHEVSLGNAKPLKYNNSFIVGKIANWTIITAGIISFTFGIITLIG